VTARTDRIDELIRQELGEILARDVRDPRIGFATVTDVETTPDLSHARVWVSVIGQPAERDAALEGLQHAMPFVRRELAHRLSLRRIPELHVRLDDTSERGTRVLRLLSELEAGGGPEGATVPAETLPTPVQRVGRQGDAPAEPGPSRTEPGLARRRKGRRSTGRPPEHRR
jgi:ribosome-binding factor A